MSDRIAPASSAYDRAASWNFQIPWPAMAINQQTPEEAYLSVLDNSEATLPKRYSVDVLIIDEVRNGYATYETEVQIVKVGVVVEPLR